MGLDYVKSGSIVSISNSSSNINPVTGLRNAAKYGIVTRTDKNNFIYYLPIVESASDYDQVGKYIKLDGLQYTKHIIGDIRGYINLDYEYSTYEALTFVGSITSNEQVYEILNRYEKYQISKQVYKPVLDIKKVK